MDRTLFWHFVHTRPFNNFALFIRNCGTTRCLNFRTAKEVPCERNAWAYKFSAGRKFVPCCIDVASHFMISQHQTSGTEPIAAFSFVSLFAFVSLLVLYIWRSQPRYKKKNTRALLEEINKWISFFFISLLELVIISLTQGLVVMSSELEDVFGSMMVGRVRLRLFSPFTG